MSFNGSGTYSLPAGNPVVTGTTISSTWANTTLSDIATGLTTAICKDGQTTPTANLPMGGFRHTGAGAAVNTTDYARADQAQNSAFQWLTTVAGTDTITASATPTPVAYAAGQTFRFVSAGANTTTSVTLNVSGLGAKNITKNGATALAVGDIPASALVEVTYDGTQFQAAVLKRGTAAGLDAGTSANNVVQLDGSAKLPAVDGSQLTGISNRQIQSISSSVGSSALTLNYAGGTLDFRSATLTTGAPITNVTVGALSITVPSTATLGTVNATQARLVLAVAYNGGSPVLCVANIAGGLQMDETNLISPTTISTSATSNATWYSASAVGANSPYRIVGFVDITESTAGTWATDATLKQGVGGQALTAMSSLGYGQVPQSVTRTAGTTYYAPGKPITLLLNVNNGANGGTATLTIGPITTTLNNGNVPANANLPFSVPIPAGMSYSFSVTGSTTVTAWEIR